jgi:hypothetical protein
MCPWIWSRQRRGSTRGRARRLWHSIPEPEAAEADRLQITVCAVSGPVSARLCAGRFRSQSPDSREASSGAWHSSPMGATSNRSPLDAPAATRAGIRKGKSGLCLGDADLALRSTLSGRFRSNCSQLLKHICCTLSSLYKKIIAEGNGTCAQ